MGRRARGGGAGRAELAQCAARLLAEGGADDFEQARRKAARELGAEGARDLPDNLEVHRALVDYLALFGGAAHAEMLARLRRKALRALRVFAPFEPALVGPVLYGTACEHTPISLHLRADEFEAVTRFLLEQRLHYRLVDGQLRMSGGQGAERVVQIQLTLFDETFELTVLPRHGGRQPLSLVDGKPMQRADQRALDELIARGERFTGAFGHAPAPR